MVKKLLLVAIILTTIHAFAASEPPKREFRAVWVATVANLDWPSSRSASTQNQKQQLINLLDSMKEAGINAILFQVRTECDALYASAYEPWSYWLTGLQGFAPSPFYDPLAFAIEEAHKRGMELHAWFNPYRAVKTVGAYTASSQHVSVTHPDWILY
ncbi:family 10 glycosylhydrolase, partial [candidate division KSB1 bacterium]|nr:family 10 glycosylhydrolase [candidate division KSB1 bacterium]